MSAARSAILALALDLVWGYGGILSLGHAAFFALGGYAMADAGRDTHSIGTMFGAAAAASAFSSAANASSCWKSSSFWVKTAKAAS